MFLAAISEFKFHYGKRSPLSLSADEDDQFVV